QLECEPLAQLPTAHSGKNKVDHGDVRIHVAVDVERGFRGIGSDHLAIGPFEESLHKTTVVVVVFDYEHPNDVTPHQLQHLSPQGHTRKTGRRPIKRGFLSRATRACTVKKIPIESV